MDQAKCAIRTRGIIKIRFGNYSNRFLFNQQRRTNAKEEAEENNLNVAFVVDNMREYCQLNSSHVVMNLFGSFGHFEDLDDDWRVVRNMYASLHPGGRFLIETMGKEILAREFQESDWSEAGDALVLAERKPLHSFLS